MNKITEQKASKNRTGEAVEYFAKKLRSGNKYDRLDAVFALSDYDSTEAISALTNALEDTYSHVRETANNGLREIGRRNPANIVRVLNYGIPGQMLPITKIFYEAEKEAADGKEKALAIICRMILERQFPGHAFHGSKGNVVVSYTGFFEFRNWLVEIGSEAVEPLIALLDNPEPTYRNYTIRILAEIGIAWAIEPLILQLKNNNVFERWKIKRILRKKTRSFIVKTYLKKTKKNPSQQHSLLKAGESLRKKQTFSSALSGTEFPVPSWGVGAAHSLIKVRESVAVKPLIKALNNKNRYVRGGAAQILYKLGWRPANPVEAATYLAARRKWKELPALGNAAVAPLFRVLRDEDFTIQNKATAVLMKIYPTVTPAPFIAALKDKDQHIRAKAAGILAHFDWQPGGDEERIGCLIARKEWDKIENPGKEAVTLLGARLTDTDQFIRKNAVKVLGKAAQGGCEASQKNENLIPGIIERSATAAPDVTIRNSSQKKLRIKTRFSANSSIVLLIGCLNDESPHVRNQAIEELTSCGDKAIRPLLSALRNPIREIRRGAAEVLEKTGWQPRGKKEKIDFFIAAEKWDKCIPLGIDSLEPLLHTANNEGYAIREKVAGALGLFNTPAALAALIGKLTDNNPIIRETVIDALGKTVKKRVIKPLMNILEDEEPEVRKRAIQSLGNFKGIQVAETLIPYLGDNVLSVQKRAEEAILKIREINTLLPFIKTFRPEHPIVQQEVAFILEEIDWQPGTNRELAFILFARPGWKASIAWNTLPVKERDAVEILIEQLQEGDLQTQGQATAALGKIGDARVLEPLLKVLYKRTFYEKWHKEAEAAFRQICARFITAGHDLICRRCFLRYKKRQRHFAIFHLPTYEFYACPNCDCDANYFKGKKIVLRLDRRFKEKFAIDNTIIYVNWFKISGLCDYDEIRIKDASGYEIEKLVMKLKNDMDDDRRKRLKEIPVYLSPQLKLSPAKMNLLKDIFQPQLRSL